MSSPHSTTSTPAIDPLQIPEILSLILYFTDRKTLVDCAKVSQLWRSCSLPVQWQVYKVDTSTLFHPPWHQSHDRTVRFIRALEVSVVRDLGYDTSFKIPLAHSIRNLTHLTIDVDPIADPQFSDPFDEFYSGPGPYVEFILQNQGLCELEVANDTYGLVVFKCLSQLPRLKKLKIVGDLSVDGLSNILSHLSGDNDNNNISSSPQDSGLVLLGSNVAAMALCELVVQVPKFQSNLYVLSDPRLCKPEGPVPIHTLRLLNFDQRDFQEVTDTEAEPITDVLLPFLRRFPDLERLSLAVEIDENSSKTLPIEYNKPVAGILEEIEYSYSDADSVPLPEKIGEELFRCCPKITSLEFGPHTLLTQKQVASLSKAYAAQLQSYIMWGILHESEDLLYMLTVQCMYKSPLVELDISGCGRQLGEAAWVVFRTLPNLRHFRALGVPLHAQQLVGYDWVCQKLETLAISVLVPKRMASLEEALDVIEYNGTSAYVALQDLGISSAVPSERVCIDDRVVHRQKKKSFKEGNIKKSKSGKNDKERKRHKEHKEHKEKSKKRKRKHDSDDDDEGDISDSRSQGREWSNDATLGDHLESSNREHSCDRLERRRTDFCAEIQIMICEQLGRLSKLRVLTLEGDKEVYSSLDTVDWTCLGLTLDTGLDRLAPLPSLETLSVYNLADQICHRREEVEWIARNWANHQDIEGVSETGHKILRPSPPFKNLLGVSVQGDTSTAIIHLNVAWLRDECPKLTIETHQPVDIESNLNSWFFSGGYQDF